MILPAERTCRASRARSNCWKSEKKVRRSRHSQAKTLFRRSAQGTCIELPGSAVFQVKRAVTRQLVWRCQHFNRKWARLSRCHVDRAQHHQPQGLGQIVEPPWGWAPAIPLNSRQHSLHLCASTRRRTARAPTTAALLLTRCPGWTGSRVVTDPLQLPAHDVTTNFCGCKALLFLPFSHSILPSPLRVEPRRHPWTLSTPPITTSNTIPDQLDSLAPAPGTAPPWRTAACPRRAAASTRRTGCTWATGRGTRSATRSCCRTSRASTLRPCSIMVLCLTSPPRATTLNQGRC